MKKTLILTAALLIMAGCSTKEPSAEAAFLSKLSPYKGFSSKVPSFIDFSIKLGGKSLVMTNAGSPGVEQPFKFQSALSDSRASYESIPADKDRPLTIEVSGRTVTIIDGNPNPQTLTLY